MKAFWLLVVFSFELTSVLTLCPEKCLCLWYSDNTLTVNCSRSGQTEVPWGIHPRVKIIDLSHNEIKNYNYPGYFTVVERIDLSNNKITKAYFGGSFNNLKSIDLSHNFIASLKLIDVDNLPHLKILNLSYNTKLNKLSGLKSYTIEVLDLSHCFISSIEEDFLENIPNIRSIDLSYNAIESFANIRGDSLEILDASHCKLKNLTQFDIFNLPNLKKLNVSFNPKLKLDFSYENACWDVRELDLSNSELASLDGMFPFCSLETLNASLNRIEIVEVRTFFNNCELVTVNLSGNRISEIHTRSFFTTDRLKVLDLSANQIQDVDFTLHLKQVITLDLSDNQISCLRKLVLKKVLNLNLSRNQIKEISLNLNENAPEINTLNLSHNKIKTIKRLTSTSINRIDFSFCKISFIETKAFEGAENLVQINLVGNKLTTLDFRILENLHSLKDLMISHNPWSCHCRSQDFKDLYEFLTVKNPLTNVQELYCSKTNDTWRNSCIDEWQREKDWKKTVYSLTVSLAIALIVIAVIFFCKYFNDKKEMGELQRQERERSGDVGSRLSSYESSSHILHVTGEPETVPNRSSTPPPNYEAALLLPKLTEEQRILATSKLSIAIPTTLNEQEPETSEEPMECESSQDTARNNN